MTTQINARTLVDEHPSTAADATTATASTAPTTKGRLPRWFGPVGVAAAVCAAGVGILAVDATDRTTTESLPSASTVVAAGQVVRPGLPDGYWEPVGEVVVSSIVEGPGQVVQPGLPDGYWQSAAPVASEAVVSDGSFDDAEAGRMQGLRGGVGAPVSDGSFDDAEAGRMQGLRGGVGAPVSDGSFDDAEAGRMLGLRGGVGAPVSDGSFDDAEAGRMQGLQDRAR